MQQEGKEKQYEESQFVWQNRLKVLNETMSDFNVESLEAEVLWEKEFTEEVDSIRMLRNELHLAIESHLEHIKGDEPFSNKEERGMNFRILCFTPNPKDDEFAEKISGVVEKIERKLTRYISRK